MSDEARNAVAEAWASIDGKLELYKQDQNGKLSSLAGYYDGYQWDAMELIDRIEARGFKLVPK